MLSNRLLYSQSSCDTAYKSKDCVRSINHVWGHRILIRTLEWKKWNIIQLVSQELIASRSRCGCSFYLTMGVSSIPFKLITKPIFSMFSTLPLKIVRTGRALWIGVLLGQQKVSIWLPHTFWITCLQSDYSNC